jgi:hypothetical protein
MTPPPSGLANAADSLHQEMAAASSVCQISPTRCRARTRLYRDGRLEFEGFLVADISDHLSDDYGHPSGWTCVTPATTTSPC